ncbi:MAG TPA: hypothetical protein VEQ36_14260 [Thermomicrobiales bacterium]|nr:hypothetical protein [Thermomicrobiales bacterium]
MAPDEHQRAERLDRYWDAVLRGETPARPAGIDDIAAAVIARLGESAVSPYLLDAQHRVRQQIVGSTAASVASYVPPAHASVPAGEGRVRKVRPGIPWHDRPILRFAAAAILVLAIVFAIDIIRPDHGPNGNHGGAPAIQAPATPSPVTTDGIVLEYTVPVADLPTTDWMRTVLDHLSIPPGTTTGGSSNCCSGPMIEYVLSGSYTVRVAAAIEVIRAAGKIEQIPVNTEVTLGPGDSLISRSETTVQITVAGPEPAELLNWILVDHNRDPTKHEEHVLGSWIVRRDDTKNPITSIPRVPLEVQIRMVVVPNGDAVPTPATGLQLVMPVDDGSFVTHVSDGSTQVFGKDEQPVTTYLLTMTQPGAPAGTPAP